MLNPFTTLPKLIKSRPMIDGLEKDFKTMNKSNWKTNTIGAITLVVALAGIWAPSSFQPKVQATAAALASVGLIAAKDGDR